MKMVNQIISIIKIIICWSVLTSANSFSQENYWKNVSSPEGGFVSSFAEDSLGNIFALSSGIIYRSSNLGKIWIQFNNGITTSIVKLVGGWFGEVYAYNSSQLYILRANALTWEPISTVGIQGGIIDFTSSPNGFIFVGAVQYNPLANGIFRLGKGETWERVADFDFFSILLCNKFGHLVKASNLIYKSTDDGNTWKQLSYTPPTTDNHLNRIKCGTTDKHGDFYFGTYWDAAEGQLIGPWSSYVIHFSSNDSIVPLTAKIGSTINSIVIDSLGYFYLSLGSNSLVIVNPDQTLKTISLNVSTRILSIFLNSNNELFVGSNGYGVFRATNNYSSWETSTTEKIAVQSLLTLRDGRTIFGTYNSGVFLQTDTGLTNIGMNIGSNLQTISEADSGNIFVVCQSAIYKTYDNLKYSKLFYQDSYEYTRGDWRNPIHYDMQRTDSGTLYAVINREIIFGGLRRSTDNGQNWKLLNDGSIYNLKIKKNGVVFGLEQYVGIVKSIDNGDNWNTINTGAVGTDQKFLSIDSIGTVYVVSTNSIYYTTNEGDFWVPLKLPTGVSNIQSIAFNKEGKIFLAFQNKIFETKSDTVYWNEISSSIFGGTVYKLAVDNKGYLYAGTDNGLFRSKEITTGVIHSNETLPINHELLQNFPNPFNPLTTIQYSLKTKGLVSLIIFDLQGEIIKTLVNQSQQTGSYKINWDGKNESGKYVSSGTYFYRLKINDNVFTKKAVFLK